MAICMCACKPDPNATPVYRNIGEYQEALTKVKDLTREPFEAAHEGFPISERERGNLKEAEIMIEGLIAYKPDNYAPWILKGLTLRTLGKLHEATEAFIQGIRLAPQDPKGDEAQAIARIYDELGTIYFEQHEFQKAEQYGDYAVKLFPDEPSILTNAASIKVELKKTKDAQEYLKRALAKAPNYQRALSLQKLISFAPKGQ